MIFIYSVVFFFCSIFLLLCVDDFTFITLYDCRKALQDPNSVIFRLYVIIVGIYAGVQFFISFLMRIPACHLLTNQCDRWPLIRFVKWLRQVCVFICNFFFVVVLIIHLILFVQYLVWLCRMLMSILLYWPLKERHYVGRGMYERSLDFIKYALDIIVCVFYFILIITHVEVLRFLLLLPINFCEKCRCNMCFN